MVSWVSSRYERVDASDSCATREFDPQLGPADRDVRQRVHVGRQHAVDLWRGDRADLLASFDRCAGHHVHRLDLYDMGQRHHVAGSCYGAGSAKEHEGRAEIDDKERQHAEHRGAIGKADQSSRGAPPALYRIGYVRIQAVDRDVHDMPFRRDLPTGRAGRGAAQSRHAARWRRGFPTNTRRSARI